MTPCSEKGRKKKIRCIDFAPDACVFLPTGCCGTNGEITLAKDEVETLRLKNIEGLDIVAGGEKMQISKSTFARIYESCVDKIADAIVHGKRIVLEK
ncbi:TPA: DUF134 domain-containing protein [Patescibacteria group bacterium]|nr:hypothetical protein P148_SR1C00001G0256 [candidate division SR1 bacterium RAAC1_SR1_1]HCY20659.1 DUF134 domain-containing protein [Candidatus Gracilibacteria bacterium]